MSALRGLPTPCALVDLERLERNAAMMRRRARTLGVGLRPHVKTHKVPAIARIQHDGAAGPLTVSTLTEARAFAAAGFRDILWALPLPHGRVQEALTIAGGLDRLGLLLDCAPTADELGSSAALHGTDAAVYIKVDCGYHRAGVDPDSDEALDLARRIHAHPRLQLEGLVTHAGHAYSCLGPSAVAEVGLREGAAVLRLAQRITAAGLPRPILSVGSTPTVMQATGLPGIDEIRPGNYAFFDAFQAAIGSCSLDDCAFTVLAQVIGRYPATGSLVLDAGALALSADPGPRHVAPDCGYGRLFNQDLSQPYPRLRLAALSQEHGKVQVRGGLRPGEFPVGSRLRIVPNHSCLAAACHPVYHALRGDLVAAQWEPVRGW